MEEIREIAKAYYVNLTEQQQKKAQDDFEKMIKLETNKSMSLTDFLDFFLQDKYPKNVACSLFKELDINGDGSLDFDEFITLFYLFQGKRLQYCRGCQTFLTGLYFTCVKCFCSTRNSYDLCFVCYRDKNFQHHEDAVFLDNYALLRLNIKPSPKTAVVGLVQENNEIKKDVDEYGQVEKDENYEGQDVLSCVENKEVANASNQENIANRQVANINRDRKRDRIGKAFSTLVGAVTPNVKTKVAGGISSAVENATDCIIM